MGYGDGYGYGMEHVHHFQPLISLGWILAGLLILLAVIHHKRRKHRWNRFHGGPNAIETLRDRYAKGEINTQEYEERKKALQAN